MLPIIGEAGFIEMVAHRLADKFIRHLFLSSKEKNYSAYVAGLIEILDWSTEFCNQFYDKLMTRLNLEEECDNNEINILLDGLIFEFGFDRLKRYYFQNAGHTSCFIDRYTAIEG